MESRTGKWVGAKLLRQLAQKLVVVSGSRAEWLQFAPVLLQLFVAAYKVLCFGDGEKGQVLCIEDTASYSDLEMAVNRLVFAFKRRFDSAVLQLSSPRKVQLKGCNTGSDSGELAQPLPFTLAAAIAWTSLCAKVPAGGFRNCRPVSQHTLGGRASAPDGQVVMPFFCM